ncbi:rhamnan synthesis F family protein [Synechococcus sp. RSCCF101]|uniref:rhamnan synthesis F family protein n=1 Tax=Synechococcus sp. RSCCF101 TaxID=2511069 RepID=UPI00177CD396|nr:rhamnan synthesis F family protein [Synechococcus sp. RSCCF101]
MDRLSRLIGIESATVGVIVTVPLRLHPLVRPHPTVRARWLCRLTPDELAVWRTGALDAAAAAAGLVGWIVPVGVNGTGALIGPASPGEGPLPSAPLLQLQAPLTPMAERELVTQLRGWWRHRRALHLFGRPLLVLQGCDRLSHAVFGLQRLRHAAANLLVLRGEPGGAADALEHGFDGQVQWLSQPGPERPFPYLQHLKAAHHRMDTGGGVWLPAVQAVTTPMEPCFKGASAEAYREWLAQASAWSLLRHDGSPDAPVWIESWSGHQRWSPVGPPDPAAVSPSLTREDPEFRGWGECRAEHLAVLVHGFYLDRLEALLAGLPAAGNQEGLSELDLYLSTPLDQLDEVEELLQDLGLPRVRLYGVANRGRDIAPFLLQLLPAALERGHTAFVKLHTKHSPHLDHGEDWGRHLTNALLAVDVIDTLQARLEVEPDLGLLAPPGTLLPTSVELHSNWPHLLTMRQRSEFSGQWLLQQRFIAGSMFAGRVQALRPLLDLGLHLQDFETETGQVDGTLAHAIERWISFVVLWQGFRLEALPGSAQAVPRFGYGWIRDND